jgi:hypothetical protein
MNVEEIVQLCKLYENLKAGGRNCKDINKVYKTIPNKPNTILTKNNKIKVIKEYFETLADDTLKQFLINKQKDNGREYSGITGN